MKTYIPFIRLINLIYVFVNLLFKRKFDSGFKSSVGMPFGNPIVTKRFRQTPKWD